MSIEKQRIYLYPITARGRDDASNPYISNLCNSLEQGYTIVNKDYPSNSGILQVYKFFPKTDIVYFNWVENIPDRKGGFLQSLLLVLLLYLFRLSGKKVIWTMHNKISHSKDNLLLKKFLFKKLLRLSDTVITHSKEGITYADTLCRKHRTIYFPHPVLETDIIRNVPLKVDKQYDVVIWGVMAPYKGLLNFLKYLNENKIDRFRILIAGKFTSEDYYKEVLGYRTNNIIIKNEFVKKEELGSIIGQAMATLFTYHGASVLSSGVLMDTLTYRATIIAPRVGAFKDLSEDDLVFTFSDLDHLTVILDEMKNKGLTVDITKIDEFLNQNTWNHFAAFFQNEMQDRNRN